MVSDFESPHLSFADRNCSWASGACMYVFGTVSVLSYQSVGHVTSRGCRDRMRIGSKQASELFANGVDEGAVPARPGLP